MYMQQGRPAGMGAYDKTGNWTWEFYPPPYGFLGPRNPAPMPAMRWPPGLAGLSGGCGCGGTCGGCGSGHDHGHTVGMGLFESGFDWRQWSPAEWTFVAVGAYLTLSIVGDALAVGRGTKKVYRRTRGAYRSLRGQEA